MSIASRSFQASCAARQQFSRVAAPAAQLSRAPRFGRPGVEPPSYSDCLKGMRNNCHVYQGREDLAAEARSSEREACHRDTRGTLVDAVAALRRRDLG